MKIYVPFNDESIVSGVKRMGDCYVYGTPTASLASIGKDETLYVVGHGRYSRGDQICGEVDGYFSGKRMVYLTASDLAGRLAGAGLTKAFGDLRLMMCWSGYSGGTTKFAGHDLTRDAGEAPFAGQLCGALKAKGFYRMIVTGYTGEVMFPKARGAVPTGIWLTDKNDNLVMTNDTGKQSLMDLLKLVQGGKGTLSDVNRTVWY